MKTVWIDLTDLVEWGGHMTGVQRVVYESAARLQADTSVRAKGFVYSDHSKQLVEASIEEAIARLNAPSNQSDSDSLSSKDKAKEVIRTLYFAMPTGVRNAVKPHKSHIKMVAKQGYHVAMKARRAALRLKSSNTKDDRTKVIFKPSDVVVVLGKQWDRPELVSLIANQKSHISFTYAVLVHDLIPVFQPHLFGHGLFDPYAHYLFEAVAHADVILCNSKSTERDVLRFAQELNFNEPKTHVVQLGDAPMVEEASNKPVFARADTPFLLSIGTIEARKNHFLIYQAYKLAAAREIDLPATYIVGSQGWLVGDMMHTVANDPQTRDKIRFFHNVSDGEKKWLFENCLFTLYPSLYEGWGLPVRESFAYKKQCITSDQSSLPEAGGGIAVHVSPYDAGQLLEAITKQLKTKNNNEINDYKPVSWKKTYASISEVWRD